MSSATAHPAPKVEQSGDVRIITFTAGVVRDVENMLARELEGRTDGLEERHLLLDFTNVAYLTSVELGTLVGLHQRLKASGGRLTLFNLTAEIYEVFTVTRLETLMGICREERAAPNGCQATTAENRGNGRREPLTPSGEVGGAEDDRGLAVEPPRDAVESLRRIFAPKRRVGASPLDGCKEAARVLSEADRRQLMLWVSRGMRD